MSPASSWSEAREGGVVTLVHANPPRHTLTAAGVRELHERLDALERDPALRVLVLTGGGEGVFIAHYEVGELAAAAEGASRGAAPAAAPAPPRRLHPFHELCLRLERLPAITLAALNGNAAGGGLELALACDFRLLADGPFRIGLPETSVGIIPGAGGTQRLTRLLGTARALDLVLHATLLAPAEAAASGLVHRVFPAARFAAEVRAFAQDLADRAPIALAAAKRAIRAGAELPLAEGLALEQEQFERTLRSEDAAGAMRAFLRGERFTWKGE
jgi:enoyl-CoA hydratase/carnithine racemase